jgi:hypothetical protein
MDGTTTTDSLGIVTLTSAAFRAGRLKEADLHKINDCADAFTLVLSLANKYHAVTGKNLPLDELPSPTPLRQHVEKGDFNAAVAAASAIKARMDALFETARLGLQQHGVRI